MKTLIFGISLLFLVTQGAAQNIGTQDKSAQSVEIFKYSHPQNSINLAAIQSKANMQISSDKSTGGGDSTEGPDRGRAAQPQPVREDKEEIDQGLAKQETTIQPNQQFSDDSLLKAKEGPDRGRK